MMERIAKGGNRAAEIVARTRAMVKKARKSAADNHNALILERRFRGRWFLWWKAFWLEPCSSLYLTLFAAMRPAVDPRSDTAGRICTLGRRCQA
jgi:hypothetical protein